MRPSRLLSLALGLAAAGFAAGPGWARGGHSGGEGSGGAYSPSRATIAAAPVALMIAAFDRNGDAQVTRAEYDAGVAASFASVAGDPGGSMSPIDLDHWAERWLGNKGALPGFYDFDTNSDNRVSREEFVARFNQIFDGYDADHDGILTRAELLTVGTPRFDRQPGQQSGTGSPAGGMGRGGHGRHGGMGGMGGMGGGMGGGGMMQP